MSSPRSFCQNYNDSNTSQIPLIKIDVSDIAQSKKPQIKSNLSNSKLLLHKLNPEFALNYIEIPHSNLSSGVCTPKLSLDIPLLPLTNSNERPHHNYESEIDVLRKENICLRGNIREKRQLEIRF